MATGAGALALPAAPGAAGQRSRGPAAPAATPRTIADFEDITGVPFVFARHPAHHEAHTHMNDIYSDAFMDMEDLFAVTPPPSRTTFIADPVAIVKNEIRDDFVIPNAVDTPDPTPIAPPWARCAFSISSGNCCTDRRLTPATLKEAVQHAIAHSMMHELKITIGIQALHF